MIAIRNFECGDAEALQLAVYTERSVKEIEEKINRWNVKQFNGKYSETFAVLQDETLVGEIFLYQHTSEVVSIGPEIFPAYRKKGIGKMAMKLALDFAKEKGFKIVFQQIRVDNAASIALHTALGFETNGLTFTSRKGSEVAFYLKSLL